LKDISEQILDEIISDLQTSLSPSRLKPYRKGRDAKEAAAVYLWNTCLSEALYPILQSSEIALRNGVHYGMVKIKENHFWFMNPADPNLLLQNELDYVQKALRELTRKRKPHDPPRIVAELTLGFWVSLFSSGYEKTIGRQIVKLVFPHAPVLKDLPGEVSARLQRMRELRNRVFHHEPVWHLRDLDARYDEMYETLGWMSPTTQDLVASLDRFKEILASGSKRHVDSIDYLIAEREDARNR
jgi:hypothetical protein